MRKESVCSPNLLLLNAAIYLLYAYHGEPIVLFLVPASAPQLV